MGKNWNTIKEYLAQCILIAFSVVLGLYLSERIEDGKKQQESEELLTTLKSEVKDNYILLKKWAPYHREVYKKLDSIAKKDEFVQEFIGDKFVLFEVLLGEGSFMGRTPSCDAWDIAKSHPRSVNIDYDKLIALSRIYNQQELTFKPGLEIFDLFNTKDVNKASDAKINLGIILTYLRDLVAREEQLMVYYKQGIRTLGIKVSSPFEK